jgi:PHP family Zn ribbon phosphoesterase
MATTISKGADEAVALDKILNDATNKGLTFISDRDARDPEDCIQVLTYGIQVLMLYLN